MNYQKEIPQNVIDYLEKRTEKINISSYEYYAYPYGFANTAGPHGGIGGSAMSAFTVEVYWFPNSKHTVYVCDGVFRFKNEHFDQRNKKW